MDHTHEELYDFISGLEVIDTHEHLPPFEDRRDKNTDVLKEYLQHYLSSDLRGARKRSGTRSLAARTSSIAGSRRCHRELSRTISCTTS